MTCGETGGEERPLEFVGEGVGVERVVGNDVDVDAVGCLADEVLGDGEIARYTIGRTDRADHSSKVSTFERGWGATTAARLAGLLDPTPLPAFGAFDGHKVLVYSPGAASGTVRPVRQRHVSLVRFGVSAM